MKKILALVLALALVLTSCAVVFADGEPNYNATVAVSGITAGNTLKLYKVAAAEVGTDNAIHYTMTTGLPEAYDTIAEIGAISSNSDAANAMANAYGNFFGGKTADFSGSNANGTTVTINNVDPGYYFAIVSGDKDTGVVYKSMLINAVPVANDSNGYDAANVTAAAKKEDETVEKTEYDPASKAYAKTTDGYSRGDSIPFKIATKFPNYPADSKFATFNIKDTPTGLVDTVSSVKVFVDNTEVVAGATTYSTAKSGDGFEITFVKAYILANAGKAVRVEYDAVLTAPAVGSGDTSNTATIEYNPNPFEETTVTPPDTDEQKTYGLVFEKVDDKEKALAGAVFALYYDSALTKPVNDLEGNPLTFTTSVVDGHAYVWWDGLAAGTYTIHEVSAPAGFVPCADFQMTLSKEESTKDNPATAETEENFTDKNIKAVNTPGAELPSTGGIGTTIFYILGGLLVIGAAVVLVARRKAHD